MRLYIHETGTMRWHGFNMEYEWKVVTNVDIRFECMIIIIWLFECIWYVSVRNSSKSLGEVSRSCFSGRDVISMAPVSGCPWWCPIYVTW